MTSRGFWDGSCTDKVCGAGITISFFIQGLRSVIRYNKCVPVKDSNSLDAELGTLCHQNLDAEMREVVLRSLILNYIQL